ncbi:hypothetical protein CEN49_19300 [Fischerella thermalis CCMEE 5273]|uniref:ferritin-like domain-containing protein n=1 Tax=Fischerella sp. TaxID=1191 RepID=UPI000C80A8E8|nr:ferritin-like domain-containing protein [Fischerella sp.]NWF61765.1 ferritin-like domain-containing protein [Fischerella sp.]PMB05030.1 hypothetical protein CEN49_19300 [Fischerella thermalis CCMEE 5273]
MLLRLIIYLGLKKEREFILAIAKIEYGVAVFCRKLSSQATDYPHLAKLLESHAQQEIKHGKMLSSLINNKIKLKGNGQWLSIFRPATGEYLIENPSLRTGIKISNGIFIEWDSITFKGEKLQGIFENFDGISQKYLAAKLLFGGDKASCFDWADKLAFMHILEKEAHKFYTVLAQIAQGTPLGAIASQIADDEQHHADYLKAGYNHFSPSIQKIEKWHKKVNFAKWGVLIDLLGIISKSL